MTNHNSIWQQQLKWQKSTVSSQYKIIWQSLNSDLSFIRCSMKRRTIPINGIGFFKENSGSNDIEYGNSIIPFNLVPIHQSKSTLDVQHHSNETPTFGWDEIQKPVFECFNYHANQTTIFESTICERTLYSRHFLKEMHFQSVTPLNCMIINQQKTE